MECDKLIESNWNVASESFDHSYLSLSPWSLGMCGIEFHESLWRKYMYIGITKFEASVKTSSIHVIYGRCLSQRTFFSSSYSECCMPLWFLYFIQLTNKLRFSFINRILLALIGADWIDFGSIRFVHTWRVVFP